MGVKENVLANGKERDAARCEATARRIETETQFKFRRGYPEYWAQMEMAERYRRDAKRLWREAADLRRKP